jgi:hypothetical protein
MKVTHVAILIEEGTAANLRDFAAKIKDRDGIAKLKTYVRVIEAGMKALKGAKAK